MDNEYVRQVLANTIYEMALLVNAAQAVVENPTEETIAELERVLNALEDKANQP